MTSRAGYWIGGLLIAVAVAGAIAWGVLGFLAIDDTVDDFLRVPAPGGATVQLEARTYVVYLEGPGAGEDFTPPVSVQILDADGERALPLAGYSGSLTYAFGGHSGTARATVTPPRAGSYGVRAITASAPQAGYGVALGESIGGRIVRTILGAFAIGGGLALAGTGLIVATAARRQRRPPPPPSAADSSYAGLAGLPG